MTFEDWVAEVPEEIKGDVLWRVEVYRLALFVADLGWHDITSKTVGIHRQTAHQPTKTLPTSYPEQIVDSV